MTFTVQIKEDHRGVSRPRVVGDEYVVDAALLFTVYHTADRVTAESLGLSTISAAVITGVSLGTGIDAVIDVSDDASGDYDGESLKIIMYDSTVADEVEISNAANINDTTIRLRVWGLI
tara:strand:+ start:96 stop:452 length:357 start_codon:yes stop_codon:yes gene_type:complete